MLIFMSQMEEQMEKEGRTPPLWLRYVDDVLAVIKTQDASSTLADLNKIQNKNVFTIDEEMDHSFPFLEAKIEGGVITKDASSTLAGLDNTHSKNVFTIEKEMDHSFLSLDVKIERSEKKVEFDIHRKILQPFKQLKKGPL